MISVQEESPSLGMNGENGKPRVMIGYSDSEGAPAKILKNNDGKSQLMFTIMDGTPGVAITDEKGRRRQVNLK